MATVIAESVEIQIPNWVKDIDSFRRWTDGDDFPEQGNVWWLRGEVWADMSRQQIFGHLGVKNEIGFVLTGLVKSKKLGRFLPDGLLLTNFEADISGNPDGTFLSYDTLESGRARLIPGKDGGFTEIQGSPDMVLEVISQSSVGKDTVTLREAYWEAGVREYWLVDARKDLTFEILRYTARGYVGVRAKDGWLKSPVFKKSFQLKQLTDRTGHPDFALRMR